MPTNLIDINVQGQDKGLDQVKKGINDIGKEMQTVERISTETLLNEESRFEKWKKRRKEMREWNAILKKELEEIKKAEAQGDPSADDRYAKWKKRKDEITAWNNQYKQELASLRTEEEKAHIAKNAAQALEKQRQADTLLMIKAEKLALQEKANQLKAEDQALKQLILDAKAKKLADAELTSGADKQNSSVMSLIKGFNQVGAAIWMIIGAGKQMTGVFMGVAQKMADAENAMMGIKIQSESLGQSSDQVGQAVLKISKDYNLQISDVARGMKFLLSSNFSLKEAIEMTTAALNIGAYGNTLAVNNLSQAYVDFARGIKTGRINIIDNIGITERLSAVLKRMHIDISSGIDLTNNSAQAQAIYNSILEEGNRLTGAAKTRAESLQGSIDGLKVSVDAFWLAMSEKLGKNFKGVLGPIKTMIDDIVKALKGLSTNDTDKAIQALVDLQMEQAKLKQIKGKEISDEYTQAAKNFEIENSKSKILDYEKELLKVSRQAYNAYKGTADENKRYMEGMKPLIDLKKSEAIIAEKTLKTNKENAEYDLYLAKNVEEKAKEEPYDIKRKKMQLSDPKTYGLKDYDIAVFKQQIKDWENSLIPIHEATLKAQDRVTDAADALAQNAKIRTQTAEQAYIDIQSTFTKKKSSETKSTRKGTTQAAIDLSTVGGISKPALGEIAYMSPEQILASDEEGVKKQIESITDKSVDLGYVKPEGADKYRLFLEKDKQAIKARYSQLRDEVQAQEKLRDQEIVTRSKDVKGKLTEEDIKARDEKKADIQKQTADTLAQLNLDEQNLIASKERATEIVIKAMKEQAKEVKEESVYVVKARAAEEELELIKEKQESGERLLQLTKDNKAKTTNWEKIAKAQDLIWAIEENNDKLAIEAKYYEDLKKLNEDAAAHPELYDTVNMKNAIRGITGERDVGLAGIDEKSKSSDLSKAEALAELYKANIGKEIASLDKIDIAEQRKLKTLKKLNELKERQTELERDGLVTAKDKHLSLEKEIDLLKSKSVEEEAAYALTQTTEQGKQLLYDGSLKAIESIYNGQVTSWAATRDLILQQTKATLNSIAATNTVKALESLAYALFNFGAHDIEAGQNYMKAAGMFAATAAAAGSTSAIMSASGVTGGSRDQTEKITTQKESDKGRLVLHTDSAAMIRNLIPEINKAVEDGFTVEIGG